MQQTRKTTKQQWWIEDASTEVLCRTESGPTSLFTSKKKHIALKKLPKMLKSEMPERSAGMGLLMQQACKKRHFVRTRVCQTFRKYGTTQHTTDYKILLENMIRIW